jgi:hypothetical protein
MPEIMEMQRIIGCHSGRMGKQRGSCAEATKLTLAHLVGPTESMSTISSGAFDTHASNQAGA